MICPKIIAATSRTLMADAIASFVPMLRLRIMRAIEFLLDVWSESQSPSQPSTPSSSVAGRRAHHAKRRLFLAKHRRSRPAPGRATHRIFHASENFLPLGGERTTQGLGDIARRCGTSVGAPRHEAPVTRKR
jgi:hypothetical protein